MAVTGNIILAWGLVPVLFPGFALASDVSETKALINQVRVSQLDNEIFAAHQAACQAEAQKNRELAIQYEQRVQSKLPLYQHLNSNQPYQLQACVGGF